MDFATTYAPFSVNAWFIDGGVIPRHIERLQRAAAKISTGTKRFGVGVIISAVALATSSVVASPDHLTTSFDTLQASVSNVDPGHDMHLQRTSIDNMIGAIDSRSEAILAKLVEGANFETIDAARTSALAKAVELRRQIGTSDEIARAIGRSLRQA